MQPRTLLVMLGIILVLGAFIFFYEKDLPSTDERRELDKKVLTIEDDDIRAVDIAWSDQHVRLQREAADGDDEVGNPNWLLVEPLQARADGSAVTGLLSSLTGLEKKRTLEDVDRAEVGLDDPEVEVTLVTDEGDVVLAVGAEVPASSDRIVGSGGVFQVAGNFVSDLTKEPGAWRDKKLFTATRGDIERITLGAGDDAVLLAKRGDELWIESPLADRADESQTDSLLTEITSLQVATFLDAPSAEDGLLDPDLIGLDPPRAIVEVVLKDETEPFRLELGAAVDGTASAAGGKVRTYGRVGDQMFEVETSLGDSVAQAPGTWRSRDWTALEVFRIESARVEDGGEELAVVREGADWKRGEDRIDYSTASDLLYAITDIAVEEVTDRGVAEERGHTFADPALSIELKTKDGGESLALYPEVDGLAAATSEGRGAVLLLSSEAVSGLREKIEAVRTAEAEADAEETADTDS